MEHGQVEATIAQEGNELLSRLLHGHTDLGAKTEERCLEVVGADFEAIDLDWWIDHHRRAAVARAYPLLHTFRVLNEEVHSCAAR